MTKVINTTDFKIVKVHSDAGNGGIEITCPECGKSVIFADYGWWENECDCGEWGYEFTATCEVMNND